MLDFELTLKAVSTVTTIPKQKILSRSRTWPVVEARMLIILFLSNLGCKDQTIAWCIKRDRTTILKSRQVANNYLMMSKSFKSKLNEVSELYGSYKQNPDGEK